MWTSAAAGSKAEKLGVKMDYVAVHTKAMQGTWGHGDHRSSQCSKPDPASRL